MSDQDIRSSETMYMIAGFKTPIEAVTVIKKTERFVTWLQVGWDEKTRTERKQARDNFFPTWEEAHKTLVSRADMSITNAQASLDRAKHRRKTLLELKP